MAETDDVEAVAAAIVAANRYMTLATADAAGRPWPSPVWFACDTLDELYWVSSVDTRHSRNLAARPELAIVIFDSTVDPGAAAAVYLSGVGAEVTGEELARGMDVFGHVSRGQGLRDWTAEDVVEPSRLRLYRASIEERFVLGPGDQRLPVVRQ